MWEERHGISDTKYILDKYNSRLILMVTTTTNTTSNIMIKAITCIINICKNYVIIGYVHVLYIKTK